MTSTRQRQDAIALLAALATYVTGTGQQPPNPSACGFDAPLVTAEVTTADGTMYPDLCHGNRWLLYDGVR